MQTENQQLTEDLLKKRTLEEAQKDDEPEMLEKADGQETAENGQKDQDNDPESEDGKVSKDEADPLSVCITGLDNFTKDKDLLKFCKNEFNPPIEVAGIIKKRGKGHAFISFPTVEEKERFEKELGNKKLKNRKIKAKPVKSGHLAFKHEKKLKTEEVNDPSKPKQVCKPGDIEAEMSVPIQEKVCPLWKVPYEDQVKQKREAMENVLKKITTNALKSMKQEDGNNSSIPEWLTEDPNGLCCELSEFIGADPEKTFYYRNKAEFTIGESYHEKKVKVGFNMGNFNKGFMFVEDAKDCPIVSKESLALAKILEDYVEASGIPAYHRMEHKGFWRAFVVRQSESKKEILMSIVVNNTAIDAEKYLQVKEELVKTFTTQFNLNDYKIVSILMQTHSGMSDNVPTDMPYEIIYGGQDYYMDEIMGVQFRVNVSAFLQVNSSQTEKLYGLVKKLANVDDNSIFLDICCGIGTIGLCTAANAKKIVGIEMVERAINDAKFNSELNNLSNTEFTVAKVENAILDAIKPYMGSNKIIGVVDPPRAGLHRDVIKALRTCKGLDKLVYVSCNPEGTMVDNVLQLCLPENKRRRAPPFTVTEAYGVDLFPQTNHFEGVLVLERLYNQKRQKKTKQEVKVEVKEEIKEEAKE